MESLQIRPKPECRWDAVSLGEVMLRLDPGDGRIRTAREFRAWEGGGEYNVTRALRKCFGMETAVVTALAENEIGHLIEDFIMQGGVDTRYIRWIPFDGIGRNVRNGLNFTEKGFGIRGALGTPDRGNSAASLMNAGDIDWEQIFGRDGVRWFHTGGIFAALSVSSRSVLEEALSTAKEHGTVISYDLNYRPSLWKSIGGHAKAQEVNRSLAKYVDVMIGNEEDFTASLGFEVEGADSSLASLDTDGYKRMIGRVVSDYPNFSVIATTLRTVKSAGVNDWGAICWADGQIYEATPREKLEIYDRVGGGDSFASGLAYGLMEDGDPAVAVEYGAAHGALAMTTPGDTSMATLAEVERLVAGGGARVVR